MKKTKLTRSLLAACSIVALSAVMYGCVHNGGDDAPATDDNDMGMEMPDPAAPVDVTMDVALGTEAQARLFAVLGMSGTSDTLTIEPGETGNRGSGLGVEFTCDSVFPCTVTVTNSLGTILASMTTQMLPDADDPMVTAALPDAVDAFAELNDGDTPSIRNLVGAADGTTLTPTLMPTELTGMGIGGPGVLDADMAGLHSSFDPNSPNATDDTVGDTGGPGEPNGLVATSGSRITGADDGFDASMSDIASAPDGWVMKTLFRDWGDTVGDGDGGFETAAIVVKNLGEGTPHPFDRVLSSRYVAPAAMRMFALSVTDDGTSPSGALISTLSTSVNIDFETGTNPATATQAANMIFDSGTLAGAQTQDLLVDEDEAFTGAYFDAPGQYQCVTASNVATGCQLTRNGDGTVGVVDSDAAAPGIQGTGMWTFTPDPDAMITVPDQDWMAYGAWLTTPDNDSGTHRMGVFFNGMDPYTGANGALDSTDAAGLRGSATYSGGATGIYVDDDDSGLFTARAMLTADFDKASDGMADTAVDYMISGRIDNFRGTDGVFLGGDTADNPNDPIAGGENDWVVILGPGDFAATPGTIAATATTGSADGLPWSGMWNGQLFGPNVDAMMNPIAPSGVAGRFWAETTDPDLSVTTDEMPETAVVGAFGATKDD